MRAHPGLLACVWTACLALSAAAQDPGDGGGVSGSHFTASGGQFLVNTSTNFTQYESKIAIRPDGQRIVVVWATAANADVQARLFDGAGNPLTGQINCAQTLTSGTQDEPTVAMDELGRFLVAWTDRHGNDGFDMGVFARVFDPAGVPYGPEFRVNVTVQDSQWEPFAAARPGGGWVVGFSGTSGGKAYMRLISATGTPQGGEKDVAEFNSKQVDPVPAVLRDGTMLFTWIDFNGKAGPGNATSVFARRFDIDGNALGGEFQVNTTNPGEQREARTAADAIGRFLVVWEDRQTDANGIDIHARRFASNGVPLSAEWEVNTTKGGDQTRPAVAYDWVGNSVVVWEDASAGAPEIRAQRYNVGGQPLGAEFVVNEFPNSDQTMPAVALDWAGERFAFTYTNLGATQDVLARRFRFSPMTLANIATPGSAFFVALDLPSSTGLQRLVLMALGTAPGIPLPDGRKLPLNFDLLFNFVLSTPGGGGAFVGFTGPMPPDATDLIGVSLPANPALSGLTLYMSTLTINTAAGNTIYHVTSALPVPIQ